MSEVRISILSTHEAIYNNSLITTCYFLTRSPERFNVANYAFRMALMVMCRGRQE